MHFSLHRIIISFLSIILGFSLYADGQAARYNIEGAVTNASTGDPLISATVYVKDGKDSTIVGFALTDKEGRFMLKHIPRDKDLTFNIFFTGFVPYQKLLKGVGEGTLDIGTIQMQMAVHSLGEVTIQAEAPPVAIKGDTIQFNAGSFKTRPNSVLADLLKKLPGVTVGKNGRITAMGRPVDKIKVNGKKFFGGDPRIALQNLPSAIVDKVQVTDTRTLQEEMAGQPGSGLTKTINITLKKELAHGFFGRAYAGYGTGEHDDVSALLNYFQGDMQLSLLGATNNINKVGFTVGEMEGMMNPNGTTETYGYETGNGGINVGGVDFGPAQSGLNTSTTGGINYNDDYGKYVSVNGSYFYGNTGLDNETRIFRQNILPDSLFDYHSDNTVHSDHRSHQINASIFFKDSLWSIAYQPYAGISDRKETSWNEASSTGVKGNLVNRSNSLFTTDESAARFSHELSIYRKLKRKNQYLSFDMRMQRQDSKADDYNSYRNVFRTGSTTFDSANQYIDKHYRNNYSRARILYSQPLSDIFSVNIGYEVQWQHNLNNKKTYNFDDVTGKFSNLDSVYSDRFRSNIVTQTPSVGINLTTDSGRWRVKAGAEFNFVGLHHYSYMDKLALDQNQCYISPVLNLSHRFRNKARFFVTFLSFITQPDISQLLPVADNTNSLYIVEGNPDLKPYVYNGLHLNYNKFDFNTGNAFFVGLGYNFTKNKIIPVTTYDQQLRQVSSYTNVNGADLFFVNANFSKTKKEADYHWQISLQNYGSLADDPAFIDGERYKSRRFSVRLRPSARYGYKTLLEGTLSYTLDYQLSQYDIESLESRQNLVQQTELSTTLYWPERLTWTCDLMYTHNSEMAAEFRSGTILWNASVGLALFKKKQATLQLSAYDLLDQHIDLRRTVSATYTEDVQTIVLHRYFMLKFIYNLNKLGQKAEKKPPSDRFFF